MFAYLKESHLMATVEFAKFIKKILSTPELGIKPKNIELMVSSENLQFFLKAFTTIYFDPDKNNNNEIFEYVGDGILKAIMSIYIVSRFPKIVDEGMLSLIRHNLEKKNTLASIANKLGFNDHIRIPPDVKDAMLTLNPMELQKRRMGKWASVLEDTYEAFIAALYHVSNRVMWGSGFVVCQIFVCNHLDKIEISTDIDELKGSIARLKEQYFDKRGIRFDGGEVFVRIPSEKSEIITYGVVIPPDTKVIATGSGKSYANAKNNAAENALKVLLQSEKSLKKKLDIHAPEYRS